MSVPQYPLVAVDSELLSIMASIASMSFIWKLLMTSGTKSYTTEEAYRWRARSSFCRIHVNLVSRFEQDLHTEWTVSKRLCWPRHDPCCQNLYYNGTIWARRWKFQARTPGYFHLGIFLSYNSPLPRKTKQQYKKTARPGLKLFQQQPMPPTITAKRHQVADALLRANAFLALNACQQIRRSTPPATPTRPRIWDGEP